MDRPAPLTVEETKSYLEKKGYFELKTVLQAHLSPDIVEIIDDLETAEQVFVFRLLSKEMAAEVFSLLDRDDQEELLLHFSNETVQHVIEEMDPDDLTELFDELPDDLVKRLIPLLSPEDRSVVSRLLNYPEESAGRLMTPAFIELTSDKTTDEAIALIRKVGLDKETIYYSYVTDEKHRLVGVVSLKDLLLAPPGEAVEKIMTETVVYSNTVEDQEEVAKLLSKYDISAVPVVDKERKLVGIITIDDVVDVITEEATEDFHKMVGIEAPEDDYFGTSFVVLGRKRALWLVILLVMSYLSSIVLKNYADILQIVIPLAFFIPMLTGTCGNTGMQSATLVIRGLATGEIEPSDFTRIFLREVLMGGFLGVILGLFSFIRAHFVDVNPFVGIAVGCAVFISVIVSNLIGSILPMILRMLKIDPAISAGPFITTIVDVTSLILYFEIAKLIFGIAG